MIAASLFSFGQQDFKEAVASGKKSFLLADFDHAASSYFKAIELFKGDDSLALADCYLNLGMLYGKLSQFKKAETLTIQAIEILERHKAERELVKAYNILGNVCASLQNNTKSIAVYTKALKLAKKINDRNTEGSIVYNLGSLYLIRNQSKKALVYFERGLEIANAVGSKYGMAISKISIGSCYSSLNQPEKAVTQINVGIDLAEQIGDPYVMLNGYEQLSKAYEKANDWKRALTSIQKYNLLKDSINSLEVNSKVVELEAKYNSKAKENTILKLNSEKQKSQIKEFENKQKIKSLNYTLVLVGCILVILLIVVLLFFRLYKSKITLNNQLELSSAQLLTKNNELTDSLALNKQLQNALKADVENYKQLAYRKQMNPHFIFNSLNSVQHYILANDKLNANYFLGELSMLIRRVLENSEKEFISLREELNICESYIRIEQKRFENKFSYVFTEDGNLDLGTIMLPPLLLQPFIENAIWHGLLHKPENAILQISVSEIDYNTFKISILDNGIGRKSDRGKKEQSESKKESMGLYLTNNRIELNNMTSQSKIELEIRDLFDDDQKPSGTEIIILLKQTIHEHSL